MHLMFCSFFLSIRLSLLSIILVLSKIYVFKTVQELVLKNLHFAKSHRKSIFLGLMYAKKRNGFKLRCSVMFTF